MELKLVDIVLAPNCAKKIISNHKYRCDIGLPHEIF
jgi:hypothetical protein